MTCASKRRITICERRFFKQYAIQGHFLTHLKLKKSHASCKSVTRRPEAKFGRYMWAMAWRTTKTFITFKHLYTFLSCGPLLRSITSNIECWSPTYTHEKLNSLRWEIILNATTLLGITTVHQSTVVIFVYSGFRIALLCAHLLNQNLILPYLTTVVQPKYSLQACLLVLVMLLLM
jgi:hypothetical protein